MTVCAYAACKRPSSHHADGWDFCPPHHREHLTEFPPPITATRQRNRATGADVTHAEEILNEGSGGFPREQILSNSRQREIVHARQHVLWRIRTETALSLPQIGALTGRDHTTVLQAVRSYETRAARAARTAA